jgi:hypothetical protein
MSYIYKNETGRPVNFAGYQFDVGQELKSDIKISRFDEAISNKFLSLRESDKPAPAAPTNTDEEAKKAAEAEAARKAEETRIAEEAKLAEEIRLAEEAKKAEEARIAQEAAEAQRVADEEAKKAAEAANKKNNKN